VLVFDLKVLLVFEVLVFKVLLVEAC